MGEHSIMVTCNSFELLLLGKYVFPTSLETQHNKVIENYFKIKWPEDYILKEKLTRLRVMSMTDDIETISNKFSTLVLYIIVDF